jgi:transposase InsO family protein
MQNSICEAFNGRMRDEFLNGTLFRDLDHAGSALARRLLGQPPPFDPWLRYSGASAASLTAAGDQRRTPRHTLVPALDVSQSEYFTQRSRPASPRQREDLVLLAHVRSAFVGSNETYGSPRITRELQDQGLTARRRRTARLMRDNSLRARQTRRFKRTTDSHHASPSRRT